MRTEIPDVAMLLWNDTNTGKPPSPFLDRGPQIDFMAPGRVVLAVQSQIGLGDGIGVKQGVNALFSDLVGVIGAVDLTIDVDDGNMHPLGAQFACHGLRQRAQAELADSKPCEVR